VDSSSCVVCHASQKEKDLRKATIDWAKDVHAQAGLGCQSCHGGDPRRLNIADPDEAAEKAMNEDKGFRGAPSRKEIPDFCGRCHSNAAFMKRYNPQLRVDQLAEYRTSVHGILNAKGDPVPATCIDCHSVHGIRPVSSPDAPVYAMNVPKTCAKCHADAKKMAPYKIPTNQYENYMQSVHATALLVEGDVSAPACNDCHGNHGATPPEVKSVANVCGQCHGREALLFNASSHLAIFEARKAPDCVVCHGNHKIGHPTPSLFDAKSLPEVSSGKVASTDPFKADVGDLPAGGHVTASWRVVLALRTKPADPKLVHHVEVSADGMAPVQIDATVRPGAAALPPVSAGSPDGIQAALDIEPLSGLPVDAGDALALHLKIDAGPNGARAVTIRDVPGPAIQSLAGAVCRKCHAPGDSCDVAAGTMAASLDSLDRDLRNAVTMLHQAELVGMDVSAPQFELKSKGTTAAVESRALIHAFDPPRLLKRSDEGRQAAMAGLKAAKDALAEFQFRRQGLAVSLVLVFLVLVGLFLKIRQIDRIRKAEAAEGSP
jgi:hypothetical protein